MKTRAQLLLMGFLSIAPLFPHESEARLFSARLIGVEEEALQQVQLSDSHEGQRNQEISALGLLALALSAGDDAMRPLRGSQTEYREKDRLKPPTGHRMRCGSHCELCLMLQLPDRHQRRSWQSVHTLRRRTTIDVAAR